jgi:hypothetical protein
MFLRLTDTFLSIPCQELRVAEDHQQRTKCPDTPRRRPAYPASRLRTAARYTAWTVAMVPTSMHSSVPCGLR